MKQLQQTQQGPEEDRRLAPARVLSREPDVATAALTASFSYVLNHNQGESILEMASRAREMAEELETAFRFHQIKDGRETT